MPKNLTPESARAALGSLASFGGRDGKEIRGNLTSRRIDSDQLSLFSAIQTPISLNAYLACALTGLTDTQRSSIFHLSDLISDVCRANGISLYEPRKNTDPIQHKDVSASYVYEHDRMCVLSSDLLIHLSHHPSTGAGEELEFAKNALLPIILISPDDHPVSRMVLGIPSMLIHIQYNKNSPGDLLSKIEDALIQVRPLLEQRKISFTEYNKNIVGEKIREIRERCNLTRDQVSAACKHMSVEMLRAIEEKTDLEANPSLVALREIATVLKTTVSELVEPDGDELFLLRVKSLIEGRQAARTVITNSDQRKLMKAVLNRLLRLLDED